MCEHVITKSGLSYAAVLYRAAEHRQLSKCTIHTDVAFKCAVYEHDYDPDSEHGQCVRWHGFAEFCVLCGHHNDAQALIRASHQANESVYAKGIIGYTTEFRERKDASNSNPWGAWRYFDWHVGLPREGRSTLPGGGTPNGTDENGYSSLRSMDIIANDTRRAVNGYCVYSPVDGYIFTETEPDTSDTCKYYGAVQKLSYVYPEPTAQKPT